MHVLSKDELRERRELVLRSVKQGISMPHISRRLGISLFQIRKDYNIQNLLKSKLSVRMKLKEEAERRFPKLAGKTFEVLTPGTLNKKRVHLLEEESGRVYWVLRKFLEKVK